MSGEQCRGMPRLRPEHDRAHGKSRGKTRTKRDFPAHQFLSAESFRPTSRRISVQRMIDQRRAIRRSYRCDCVEFSGPSKGCRKTLGGSTTPDNFAAKRAAKWVPVSGDRAKGAAQFAAWKSRTNSR